MENLDKKLEKALTSQCPVKSIRELITDLLNHGVDRSLILMELDKFRLNKLQNRESENDVILDVMDYLSGWCNPDAKL